MRAEADRLPYSPQFQHLTAGGNLDVITSRYAIAFVSDGVPAMSPRNTYSHVRNLGAMPERTVPMDCWLISALSTIGDLLSG